MSPNKLAAETSPYLLQHSDNPVDWFPWSDQAFAQARERDVPVLLSVGYAACHWCHVMAHESFEDGETAALMNERFVNIKVDREERPDVDAVYMEAVQAMTGRGGWPMTVFLTPEGEPFYAGTYFPDRPRQGMPSFQQILTAIAATWQGERDKITTQADRVTQTLAAQGSAGTETGSPMPAFEARDLATAVAVLCRGFDEQWGGFGGAPKFPSTMTIEFLLRAHLNGNPEALEMATVTLDHMADGGMHDQIGGGFSRYSVDERWHVPHFEKMLYDNAQLAHVYTRAWQVTGSEDYRRVAEGTLDYMLREMQQDGGGFFSSQDADSEGVEGKFFVWSWDRLVEIAGEPVARWFGALPEGNWAEGGRGANVLWTPAPLDRIAEETGLSASELRRDIDSARLRLFEERERRVHPATDDKIVTAWNGLAINAFAVAGRVFDEPRYLTAAEHAAGFILDALRDAGGRLLRSWRKDRAGRPGYLDDHAAMAAALLTLYEATGTTRWFTEARALADAILHLFPDEAGGFFQTGSDAEALIVRPKEIFDNATPSGSSLAATTFLRLSLFTGDHLYEDAANSALAPASEHIARFPNGFGQALVALDLSLSPAREVALIGERGSEATRRLTDVMWNTYRPNVVIALADPDDLAAQEAVPLLRDRPQLDGQPTAYVCERFACRRPVTEPEDLVELLS